MVYHNPPPFRFLVAVFIPFSRCSPLRTVACLTLLTESVFAVSPCVRSVFTPPCRPALLPRIETVWTSYLFLSPICLEVGHSLRFMLLNSFARKCDLSISPHQLRLLQITGISHPVVRCVRHSFRTFAPPWTQAIENLSASLRMQDSFLFSCFNGFRLFLFLMRESFAIIVLCTMGFGSERSSLLEVPLMAVHPLC